MCLLLTSMLFSGWLYAAVELNDEAPETYIVKKGDTLLVLEAMKMEYAISAPKDGIIKAIAVKSGGTVEKGALMIEMA